MAALDREELRRRLSAARDLDVEKPGGASKETFVAAMEGVLADAEALGDPELLFEARLRYGYAMRSDHWRGASSKQAVGEVLGVLRKCLLMWHAEPHRYPANHVTAMWTQLFNVVDWYVRFDFEPAGRVHRLLDELERRCPPTRPWSRYAIDDARMKLEARRGNVAEVERLWRRLRAQGPPEEHYLPAGHAASNARMWTRLGRHDLALAAAAPVLAGHVPAREDKLFESVLLLPYLHLGRLDEAVDAHRRTDAPTGMLYEDVAAHLEFCARTGNERRGMEVLRRNLHLTGLGCGYVVHMWTAAAGALLCRRVCELGLDREWFWPCGCDEDDCDDLPLVSYAKLGLRLRWDAVGLAREIGEQDGSTWLAERVEALIRAEPVVDRLELAPPPAGPSARDGGAVPPADHLDVVDAAGLRRELERAKTIEEERARIGRMQRVLQNATMGGLTDVVVDARFGLLDDLLDERRESRRTDLFSTLDALFRLRDDRPDLFGAERVEAMWRAVPVALGRVLARPGPMLRYVREFLDRLEAGCRPETEDPHHVRWFRVEVAARAGDAGAARDAWARFRELPEAERYAERESVPRRVQWWIDLGCDEEAVVALAGREGDEREDLLLLPYLRTGLAERAREVHERTYRTASGAPEVAAHLQYCVETGALERGREILLRTLDLFLVDEDEDFAFDLLRTYAAAVRLCERLVAAGLDGPWTWPESDGFPAEDGWSFARMAESCRDFLGRYARGWEELVGTTFHTRAVHALAGAEEG
ncbi:hypothetical protein [Actinomadura algeriensis]|uniref:Tetratricopeptide repeat protein n=1 Tax=Actinomadura algeriensis TaxID=1679523 RepID=A0ABR9K326_9ACTN|nr:hypothetical protein [Actinomadura algeriensis]MBE1537264.1 hypothetical protein [Actinomadura algeriensis]